MMAYGGRADNWTFLTNIANTVSFTLDRSNTTGSRANIKFNGSTIAYFYSTGPDRGTASIYIDNTLNTTFNPHTAEYRRQIGKIWTVPAGDHTFEVRLNGGGYIDVDAMTVNIATVGNGPYDDTNSQFRYLGSWTQATGVTGAYNNTHSLSNTSGSFFRFTFTGSQISYLFMRAYNRGIAAITIDGNDLGYIDMWNPTVLRQQSVTYGNLGAGPHIINVLVTGTKNAQAQDTFVDVDELIVP